jgi:cell fate regulator YaaT (PSP1 superfamily)
MEIVEIVRVKFRWPGQMYEFVNSNGLGMKRADKVVVATDDGGTMIGTVSIPPRIRQRRPEDKHLTSVIRLAEDQDLAVENISDEFRLDVKRFFETRIRARQIGGVRLVDIEKLDGGMRIVVYFTSENRRFPARDFAVEIGQRFNVRTEMRSVGIRDAARLAGGIGKCGLSLCCSTWLPDFQQVSIRMAKDQGLSLEPDGISGQCGRLLCCLGYEHQNYVEMGLGLPKVGKVVITPLGDSRVVKLDVLKGTVTVRTEEGIYETFTKDQVRRKFGPGSQHQDSESEDEDDDGGQEDQDNNETSRMPSKRPTEPRKRS